MAKLHTKKGNYYAVFYDRSRSPNRKWVSLRTKEKTVARQRFSKLERRAAMDLFDPWVDSFRQEGVMLDDAISEFLDQRSDRSERTIRSDRSLLETLSRHLPINTQLRQIDSDDVKDFLARDLSDSTRKTYYNRLNRFFNWAYRRKITKGDPLKNIRPPRVGTTKPVYLKKKQYENILKKIRTDVIEKKSLHEGQVRWLEEIIQFAVGTGLRLSEICNLQ